MRSLSEVVRRIRGSSSAVDLDTEAGRAFLQERVALFNEVSFLISGSFFLASLVLTPFYAVSEAGTKPGVEGPLLHAATLLVSLAAWQLCRRGPPLSLTVLLALDAGSLFLPVLGFCLQTPYVPPLLTGRVAEALVLILTNMAIARAILVPTSAPHTARVSLLSALPVGAALVTLGPDPGLPRPLGAIGQVWSGLWVLCAVVVAILASHVIYGLRREVQRAQRLGQYTLEEKLGEGGMGTVYRARHAMLRRPTAIKLLPPDKAGHAALERFEREVQLTAALSHPNTVSVFDYGRTPDGVFYYAMEYLEGTNLGTLVREDGPQAEGRVVHVLEQVASALAEAHGIGLIHRDVKPENVILCERGGIPDVAKVVDFGLVKDLERGPGTLTRTDVLQGTPLYLSPEAITAPTQVSPRSDIYALGAVGYYLLTGHHLFDGATVVEVCSHHIHTEPVPPSTRLGRPLHPGLEALILACLAKDPAGRPEGAQSLRQRLHDLADLPPWSEGAARAWWEKWRARQRERRPPTSGGSATLSITLEKRDDPARPFAL